MMWRKIRIGILLFILATVAQQTWLDRVSLNWKNNFHVAVYPINADGSAQVAQYLQTLKPEDFALIETYFEGESARYKLPLVHPVYVELGKKIDDIPPVPPENANMFNIIVWSLKFRWYAWVHRPATNVPPDIRLYLLYYNPATHDNLRHSTALNKGRIGRVNLFGDVKQHAQNLVIITHELLHTLSATDKYDLVTHLPIYPDGFANASQKPLYPQKLAEIMGGRVPISQTRAYIPANLAQTLVGEKTAHEIGWLN